MDSSFTLVEERRGSGRAKLSCIGRDIEYRELELKWNEDHLWELVSDSREQPEHLGDQIVPILSEFMEYRNKFIGTPTELAEHIDPAGKEGITAKTVFRRILQSVDSLREIGICAVIRRSNGKRLIELSRADSAEHISTPSIDPCGTV